MTADLNYFIIIIIFHRGCSGCLANTQRKSVSSVNCFSKKWQLFTPKALPGGNSSRSRVSLLCALSLFSFSHLFPLQLIHGGLQRKCIWVLILVPPQLQAKKRSLICLTFAINLQKCSRKQMSHISFFLRELLHSLIMQASCSNNTAPG